MIINFKDITSEHKNEIGNKAWFLHELEKYGCEVPEGFIITTEDYLACLKENNIEKDIESISGAIETGKEYSEKLTEVRKKISEVPYNDIQKILLKEAILKLGTENYVVRSSANLEDLPGSSFAGQYDSFLGLRSVDEVSAAINKCRASLWKDSPVRYMVENGIDPSAASMAVLVQEQVNARISGVAFSVNPVTADNEEIIIESSEGTAEALVAGRKEPLRYIIDKNKLKIKEVVYPLKTALAPNAEKTEPDKKTKSIILSLAKLVLKLEKKFDMPLDVEWAHDGSRLYVIQARPVTAFSNSKIWRANQVWTNMNAGEIFPDVVTPSSWSVALKLGERVFNKIFSNFGLRQEDYPVADLIAGRFYFNLNTVMGLLKAFPFTKKIDVNSAFGGQQIDYTTGKLPEISDQFIPKIKSGKWNVIKMIPSFVLWTHRHRPEKGMEFYKTEVEYAKKLQTIKPENLTDNELEFFARFIMKRIFREKGIPPSIAYLVMGVQSYILLSRFCVKFFKDEHLKITNGLMKGLGDMDSANAGFELWNLALFIRGRRNLMEAVVTSNTCEEFNTKMLISSSRDEYSELWRRFLLDHGHHTRGEIELMNPRWAEQQDYLFGLIKSYLKSDNDFDPVSEHAKLEEQRENLTEEVKKKIGFILTPLFNFLLDNAQLGSQVRENMKSLSIRYMTILRNILLEMGKRMVEKNMIQEVNDIFFLHFDETVKYFNADEPAIYYKKIIAQRMEEYAENKEITPPAVIRGEYTGESEPEPEYKSQDTFYGLSVSPGIVRGRAKIVHRSDNDEKIEPGEILVAPFTDPGWTPYFVPAAGLVMEIGGLLSHGSIVAREYGLPAVVNVRGATKAIKNGQLLEVNGDEGTVKILEE